MIRTSKPAVPTIFLKISKINLLKINQYINTLVFPTSQAKKKKVIHDLIILFAFYTFPLSTHSFLSTFKMQAVSEHFSLFPLLLS